MLKIKLDAMIDAINEVSLVASSVTLSENQRTVVILAKENKVYFYAGCTTSEIRVELPEDVYELTAEEMFIQVRVKEIQALLYTLDQRKTTHVTLEQQDSSILFSSSEVSTFSEHIQNISVHLDLITVPSTVKDKIMNIPIPESEIDTEILSVYLEYLVPNLDSVEETMDSSKLIFGSDAVFTLSGSSFTYMVSELPEEFRDIILSKTPLSVLQSIFNVNPTVGVLRDDVTHSIVVQSGLTLTICHYKELSESPTLKNYPQYIEMSKIPNYLGIDRAEFKTVLKRLSIFSEPVRIEMRELEESYDITIDKDLLPESYIQENCPYLLQEEERGTQLLEEEEPVQESLELDVPELKLDFDVEEPSLTLEEEPKEPVEELQEFISENTTVSSVDNEPLEEIPSNSDEVTVTVTHELVIKNSKFTQTLPILYQQGDFPKNVKTVIKRVETLQTAVLGNDQQSSDILLLGIRDSRLSYEVTLYDSYETWVSYFSAEK